jgi:FkbM family methyltransferase
MTPRDLAINYYINFENLSGWLTPSFIPTHSATIADAVEEVEVNWRKATNKILVENFFNLIQKNKCDFFVEIGAFDASTSLAVEKLGVTNLVAFEANKFTHNKFKDNFNNSKVKYLNYGVSNTNEHLTIKIPKISSELELPNSSFLSRAEGSSFTEIEVDCISFDQILDHLEEPLAKGAMWIDVEGFAYKILKSDNNLLNNIDLLFIEVEDFSYWNDQKLVIDIFEILLTKNFVPIMRDFEGRGQYNIVFVKNYLDIFYNGVISKYIMNIFRLTTNSSAKNRINILTKWLTR